MDAGSASGILGVMMDALLETAVTCPYCGEPITLLVDASVTEQSYVEDCEVCCRPMVVLARAGEDGGCRVAVRREDDG